MIRPGTKRTACGQMNRLALIPMASPRTTPGRKRKSLNSSKNFSLHSLPLHRPMLYWGMRGCDVVSDYTWIVSLVSVITSAVVTIFSVSSSAKTQRLAENERHAHQLELERFKHTNTSREAMCSQQMEIVSRMAPLAVQFDLHSFINYDDLYALTLKLIACSEPDSLVRQRADFLLDAVTLRRQEWDHINWFYLVNACADAINPQTPVSPVPLPPTPAQPTPPHTSRPRPTLLRLFAKFASAARTGFRAFLHTLRSNSK